MKYKYRHYATRFNFLETSIIIVFLFLVCMAFNLQVLNNHTFNAEIQANVFKKRKLSAPRGDILDRNGVVLASTTYQNDLYILPHYFHDNPYSVCDLLAINCSTLITKINKQSLNKILVAQNVNDELAMMFKCIPGLSILRIAKRNYNTDTATPHIVGYIGKIDRSTLELNNDNGIYANDDYIGWSGLEAVYDKALHGINGYEQYVMTANGLELANPNNFLSVNSDVIPPIKGTNLYTSIDSRLQELMAREIGYRNGAGVVLNVNDGSVLALYSSPNFDPNNIKSVFRDNNHPLLNRALRTYAPGSTFKLIVALAALETGVIKPNETFNCPGYFKFGGRRWKCWKSGKHGNGHGKVDFRKAIKESCDVYFYELSLRVGLKNINKYAKMLGFGEYTRIDLTGDDKGNLQPLSTRGGDLLNSSIGQGKVQVSPLQLAMAYSTIVNNGKLYQPKIIIGEPVIVKQNQFKPETIRFLKEAMWAVVNEENGTAFANRINGLGVIGKSGTSQTGSLKGKSKDNAWFVSIYNYEHPEIVVVVFVESGGHGASTSAPITFKIIQAYSQLNVPISN